MLVDLFPGEISSLRSSQQDDDGDDDGPQSEQLAKARAGSRLFPKAGVISFNKTERLSVRSSRGWEKNKNALLAFGRISDFFLAGLPRCASVKCNSSQLDIWLAGSRQSAVLSADLRRKVTMSPAEQAAICRGGEKFHSLAVWLAGLLARAHSQSHSLAQ